MSIWSRLTSFTTKSSDTEAESGVDRLADRLEEVVDTVESSTGHPRGSSYFSSKEDFLAVAYTTRPAIALNRAIERYETLSDGSPLGALADSIRDEISNTKSRIGEPWETWRGSDSDE